MDELKIDNQKISYFPSRVGQWLEAGDNWQKIKKIYPVYMEISPSSGCNHRCVFCALDFLEYKPGFLNYESYSRFMKIAAAKGVRSIMFGGEGEPLLHPRINDMVAETKKAGIDVAFTTNGSLMTDKFLDRSMGYCNWIKISLDAGTPGTHAKIHGTTEKDFTNILHNIEYAARLRRKKHYECSIGVQILLLPQNYSEILDLAKTVKELGADYFVVKPYSQGLYSRNRLKIDYRKLTDIADKVNGLTDKKFNAVFRTNAFGRIGKKSVYPRCLATPFFWAYIMTNGDVYSCSVFIGNRKFVLGNINDKSFDKIWEGEKRKANWLYLRKFPADKCRENCRMDKVNLYLHDLKNPPYNYTFI